jgi:hypothetical protein
MRTTELFRSCSNEYVAAAALACIGGALERRVEAAARSAGLSRGAYVVRLLLDYDRKAGPKHKKSLEQGMCLNEMPILAGLRHVVETVLEDAWDAAEARREARAAARTMDGVDPSVLWSGGAAVLRDGSVHKILHS